MYWLGGTTNIFKATWSWKNAGRASVITFHYRPKTGVAELFDARTHMGTWYDTVGVFLFPLTGTDSGAILGEWEYVDGPGNDLASGGGQFGPSTPTISSPAPEASYLFRRAGAGPFGPVRGRFRFGPVPASCFTDAPRCRHLSLTVPAIHTAITNIPIFNALPLNRCEEVLYNRWHGWATRVDTYSTPTRTGRVWQRAGFPQGVRGPDRH